MTTFPATGRTPRGAIPDMERTVPDMSENETDTKLKIPTQALERKDLNWAQFGMLCFIEMHGDCPVSAIEAQTTNGVEGNRHLLRQLRDLELVGLTRHTNQRKQFTGGTYALKKAS